MDAFVDLDNLGSRLHAILKEQLFFSMPPPVESYEKINNAVVVPISNKDRIYTQVLFTPKTNPKTSCHLNDVYALCEKGVVTGITVDIGGTPIVLSRIHPDMYPFYFKSSDGRNYCIQDAHDDKGIRRAVLYSCYGTEPEIPIYAIIEASLATLPYDISYKTNDPYYLNDPNFCALMDKKIATTLSVYDTSVSNLSLEKKNDLKIARMYDAVASKGIKNSDPENNMRYYDISDESGRPIRYVIETNDGRKMSHDGFIRLTQPELWEKHKDALLGKDIAKKNRVLIAHYYSLVDIKKVAAEVFDTLIKHGIGEKDFMGIPAQNIIAEKHPLFLNLYNTDLTTNDNATFNLTQNISWQFFEKNRADYFNENKDSILALKSKIPITEKEISFSNDRLAFLRGYLQTRPDLQPILNSPIDVQNELFKSRIYEVAYIHKETNSHIYVTNTLAIDAVLATPKPTFADLEKLQETISFLKKEPDSKPNNATPDKEDFDYDK